MEDTIKELGFKSVEEWQDLVFSIDLTTPEKLNAFSDWKYNDGTKNGLLELLNKQNNGHRHETL